MTRYGGVSLQNVAKRNTNLNFNNIATPTNIQQQQQPNNLLNSFYNEANPASAQLSTEANPTLGQRVSQVTSYDTR